MTDATRDFFNTLAKVLCWCWVFGFVLLFIWFGGLVSRAIYVLHGPLMRLSDHELDVFHYCGLASLKVAVLTLFFIPWLSIRLVLRKGTS
jgi:hypothetical protein